MFKPKAGRRRRSELRLGAESINYKTSPSRVALSISPLVRFWRVWGAKTSGLLLLSALGWVAYFLFTTPEFFVYEAKISGNAAVSASEIYITSGIDSQSVFWINPTIVKERLEALPNIKSASISVMLPGSVAIKVVERRPELVWQTGETVWWIDEEGTVVPPKQTLDGMLRIIDDERQPLKAGAQIDQAIVDGAQTLRLLVPDVSVIRYSRTTGLIAATPEGWPVYLGDGHQIRAKLVVLTELLADLNARNVQPAFIDIRDPQRPFYRPHNIIQIGSPVGSEGRVPQPPRIAP
ncbi:MAG: FtsQ-type POTRA domain-containing protein [Anaerolineae bacterium]|nr:FtsQ-type POTRA domain-containing protein [Anaerolineae bacterium]